MREELFAEVFPIKGKRVWLERVPNEEKGRVVLRLFLLDEDGQIRDIKEQEIWMVPLAAGDVPEERLEAYFRGWGAAVRRLFDEAPFETFETLMPHDLVVSNVLKVKKAKTADEFRDACLVKSRLGKFLPA